MLFTKGYDKRWIALTFVLYRVETAQAKNLPAQTKNIVLALSQHSHGVPIAFLRNKFCLAEPIIHVSRQRYVCAVCKGFEK